MIFIENDYGKAYNIINFILYLKNLNYVYIKWMQGDVKWKNIFMLLFQEHQHLQEN